MTMEQKDSSLNNTTKVPDMSIKKVKLKCDKHGEVEAQSFNIGGRWSDPRCPACAKEAEDEREAKEKARKEREARDMRQRMIEKHLGSSGIPERFKAHSFDTYVASTPDQKQKLDRCKQYASEFENVYSIGQCMIFCGKTGTGKTHLSCSIANHIIKEFARSAVFMNVIKAVRTVKETYGKKTKSEQEAIDWFKVPDLLILDEVGVQFGSDAEKMILFEILNERYQDMKPTILISNKEPAELVDFIGNRVLDRFRENGGRILKFDWDSHRAS